MYMQGWENKKEEDTVPALVSYHSNREDMYTNSYRIQDTLPNIEVL